MGLHRGCITRNIARDAYEKVARTMEPRNLPVPRDDHVAQLDAAATGWVRALLALYTDAGLTRPEATALPWSAIDFDSRVLSVTHHIKEGVIHPFTGKRQARTIPMSEKLVDALSQWRRDPLRSEPFVLGHPNGRHRDLRH